MKISRDWLQTFFETPLPGSRALADALMFHAFEIESVEGDILDVKITPNRGHDCLSHRGIAKELSAILDIPMNRDDLREPARLEPHTDSVAINVRRSDLCKRFTAAYVTGVKVGPSPEWLSKRLEAVGQRSINTVVDATNYLMFHLGQPLHAFDARKLHHAYQGPSLVNTKDGPWYPLTVRMAESGERMLALDEKEYALDPSMLIIADGSGQAVSIAGIKGGKPTGIDEQTTDIILEAANWDGPMIRKTSQTLKLRTDASERFQQVIAPGLAAHGLKACAELILKLAGGTLVGYVDEYPTAEQVRTVAVSLEKINAVLGITLRPGDVADVFRRLDLPFVSADAEFTVTIPLERLDLIIAEDLIEEVGRIIGYDKIPATPLPAPAARPQVNPFFHAAEEKREALQSAGYSEVYTSVFADKGERVVANKVDGVRPYLRTTLSDGLKTALDKNMHTKQLLGLKEVKLFEIGHVWKGGREYPMVATIDEKGKPSEQMLEPQAADSYGDLPLSRAARYQPFSKYPFIVRDIAMWVPEDSRSFTEVIGIFGEHAQGLLRHVDLFDQFKKGERVSYAFHLVFQSFDRTLTDEEVNTIMQHIYDAVKAKGWEVR